MISRPFGSMVRLTHEPSPFCATRINSALKPGNSVNDSAGAVAATAVKWADKIIRAATLVNAKWRRGFITSNN